MKLEEAENELIVGKLSLLKSWKEREAFLSALMVVTVITCIVIFWFGLSQNINVAGRQIVHIYFRFYNLTSAGKSVGDKCAAAAAAAVVYISLLLFKDNPKISAIFIPKATTTTLLVDCFDEGTFSICEVFEILILYDSDHIQLLGVSLIKMEIVNNYL
uniref:Uncharacterized protein n=1 Tax=Glossina brevipalpis TaxID=37001 RepID=A0A1A9X1K4_9MUSC